MGVESTSRRNGGAIPIRESIQELAQLATTAGATVASSITQRLDHPSPSHYLGKGKIEELITLMNETECNLVIFDDELSPNQQRELERALDGAKVIDRTALILDIFARRAQTHEGRLQVELAQMEYLLPRLAGQWSHLERLGGGIGTRGPGESQLETDRRLVRRRISHLKSELEEVRRHRGLIRRRRRVRGVYQAALVGYTNAGKSTLLNALAQAHVLSESKLFSTLDPTTRAISLPKGGELLLTDTVGFIQKLPHQLVAAFRATLEELQEADVLVYVVDITHTMALAQYNTVLSVLGELGLQDKKFIVAGNKIDKIEDSQESAQRHGRLIMKSALPSVSEDDMFIVSAARGWGLDHLLGGISGKLEETMPRITVRIPYNAGRMVELFRRYGSIEQQKYQESGTLISGKIPARLLHRFSEYLVAS